MTTTASFSSFVRSELARLINAASLGHLKLGWWSSPYTSSVSPIIIGGSPRSGTTLVRVILDNHPQIWIGPENGVFQEGGQNIAGMEVCLGLPAATLTAIQRRSRNLGQFVETAMAQALSRHGKPIWGLKSPSVVHALDTVFRYFPRARFVHTIRDGRDVACSLRTHPKYRVVDGRRVATGVVNSWPWCVKTWVDSTRAGLRWRESPQYREVRYEDLVAEPEPTIRSLLEWLDLPFSESVLRYHEQTVNEGIDSHHPGIARPVYASAVGRWLEDLPPDARAAFGENACQLLVDLGYGDATEPWTPAVTRPHAASESSAVDGPPHGTNGAYLTDEASSRS